MREVLARIIDWFRRDRLDAELSEELRFHKTQLEREARAHGAEPDDAAWGARRQLGNTTRVIEAARERWSVPWLDHLQQDTRYAFRGLRRSPAFAIPVILTLGLGIGANAAMFGVVDRLMFRPDPYLRDPRAVDRVYLRNARWDRGNAIAVFPYTRYLDLKRWTKSFSQYAAFATLTTGVGTGENARERGVLAVSASFFDFFDARPAVGRFFTASEDTTPVGASVAVLSHALWQTEFGGREVVGQRIQVGNAAYTIIGVAPERFVGVSEGPPPSVFVPITAYAANRNWGTATDYFLTYSWDWMEMIVRRKPGVERDAATMDLTSAYLLSWNASRVVHPDYGSAIEMRPEAIAGPLKTAAGPNPGLEARTLLWVTGVAAIVLLIACANVANLLLARAMRRRREMALRRALGVSRGRLTTQAFTETLVLSLLGCVTGVVFAQGGGVALRRVFISDSATFDVLTDGRTVAVAAIAALTAALITGIAPVLFAGHDDITGVLKSGAREGTYRRSVARTTLLVSQGALSVVLLVGAGLFVRSLDNVRGLHLGYDVDRVLLADWDARGTPMDSVDVVMLRRRMVETVLGRSDVERAAWVGSAPFARGTSILKLDVPGVDSVSRLGRFTYQVASPGYFETMRTRLVSGRSFTDADQSSSPHVVIVSQAMATRLWPSQQALGKCIKISWGATRPDSLPCRTVVGVAENVVHDPIADLPMRYYVPDTQVPFGVRWLLVRMRRNPIDVTDNVRRTLQAVMPGNALVTVQPAHEMVDAKRRSWLVGATLFVGFGVLALLVAAVGLYGVIAYTVAQRMHELGVRIALGAQARDIVRLVVGQGARFATIGLVAGSAIAFAASRWVQPLLFQQSAKDPFVFGVVGLLLIAVALTASWIPALKATRADPNTVLRAE